MSARGSVLASAQDDCNACPAGCGDGQCSADESCDSCALDCGECCGDGTCDDSDEDWESCWADCSASAPMLVFDGLHGGCTGQTQLFDHDPDHYLWVRADTRVLMYADDESTLEVEGSEVIWESDYWNAVHIDGTGVGYVSCADLGGPGCAASIATYSTCEVPSLPGQSSSEVVDFTLDGNTISYQEGASFVACASLCGNGTCDPHETSFPCTNLSHACEIDCS